MTVNRHYSVIVHQITSPRAVQAFLVITFGLAILTMAMAQMPIPEIISYALASIIGYYFGDAQDRAPVLLPNGNTVDRVAKRVDDSLRSGVGVPARIPVDAVVETTDDPAISELARRETGEPPAVDADTKSTDGTA